MTQWLKKQGPHLLSSKARHWPASGRILPYTHTNSTRIHRWRNKQGFLSQEGAFHLKPMPLGLLISSLATYTWLLHSCGLHFAADTNRRMPLALHCQGPPISLLPAAAGTSHFQFTAVHAKNMDFDAEEGKSQGGSGPASRGERKTNKVRGRQSTLGNCKHRI